MKTRAVFAILSLFLISLLAMPPTKAGTTQQNDLTVQATDVMEAGAYEMTITATMQSPAMCNEPWESGEITPAECSTLSPSIPEASQTGFVRLWYTSAHQWSSSHLEITQHFWHY